MIEEIVKQNLFLMMKDKVYKYNDEPFILASGRKSHHYFNCKEILLYPDRLSLLSEYIVNYFIPKHDLHPQAIGGLTMGADPISYAVSLSFHKNGKVVYPLVVRKETKDHGTKKLIEGAISSVTSCMVVDDVITTGGSTLKAVEALRSSGIKVDTGICILDREEGGMEALRASGVTVYPIFKKSDFGDEFTREKE